MRQDPIWNLKIIAIIGFSPSPRHKHVERNPSHDNPLNVRRAIFLAPVRSKNNKASNEWLAPANFLPRKTERGLGSCLRTPCVRYSCNVLREGTMAPSCQAPNSAAGQCHTRLSLLHTDALSHARAHGLMTINPTHRPSFLATCTLRTVHEKANTDIGHDPGLRQYMEWRTDRFARSGIARYERFRILPTFLLCDAKN